MAADLIVRVRGRATTTRDRVTRVRGRAAASITVSLGVGRNVEPGDEIVLQAAASRVPDSWLFEQTDGYPVALVGSGSQRKVIAPMTPDGTDIEFRVTVALAGATPAVATVEFHVYPHTMWRPVPGDIAPSVLTV